MIADNQDLKYKKVGESYTLQPELILLPLDRLLKSYRYIAFGTNNLQNETFSAINEL
jgi:hypothetical protein